MKTLTFLLLSVWCGMAVSAQNQSPIPKISQQMASFYSYFPKEKVFLATDKSQYKPGETIWFHSNIIPVESQAEPVVSNELWVKLYDSKGTLVAKEIFRLKGGSVSGDISIPKKLEAGIYTLVAFTSAHVSPDEVSYNFIKIDPEYLNQWVAHVSFKDSLSTLGQANELRFSLREISGDILKNTQLRYQLMSGSDVFDKGKLKTDDQGKVALSFTLPATSAGEPFICRLSDVKDDWKKDVLLPSNSDRIDIRFYPEGGNLVSGIPSKIGFTAFNSLGMPVNVDGNLVDSEGKNVGMVKTLTKGLGMFSAENVKGQKYRLVVAGKAGPNQTFDLPAALADGVSLAIVKTDAEFVTANIICADKQKHSLALLVTRGGIVSWAADMEINGLGRVKIPTENLSQGINLLSVFSTDGKLQAQRIIYTDKKIALNIEVKPEKTSLKPDESMKVKVRMTDATNQPVSGMVSISASDQYRNFAVKTHLDDFFLIGSELETPFELISEVIKDKVTNSALFDVYLISNRIKGFDWNKIIDFNKANTVDPNTWPNGLSGVVTDKEGQKVNKAKVSLVNNKTMQITTTTTNSDGRFSFPNLNSGNADDFTAKATDPEGKHELKLSFNKNFDDLVSDYISSNAMKFSLTGIENSGNENYHSNNPDLFVKAPKVIRSNTNNYESQQKMLANATSILDVIKTIKSYKIQGNLMVFSGSENSFFHQGGALFVLDGQQLGTDIAVISSIAPNDVDHINVSTNAMDIHKYTGLNSVGVVEIYLKRAKSEEAAVKNTNKYDGAYRIPNSFTDESVVEAPGKKTTLVWLTDQQVNDSGEYEFTVKAGKVISDFLIEVQGISSQGLPGCGKAGFSVTK